MSNPAGEQRALSGRVGVWLIGARGAVATTSMTGASALAAGLVAPLGLVTCLPPFEEAGLCPIPGLVFGGHDVSSIPLMKHADLLAEAGVIPPSLARAAGDRLAEIEGDLRPGVESAPAPQIDAVHRLADDLRRFRAAHALAHVVVINVSSTEPAFAPHPAHEQLEALDRALESGEEVLPPSSVYARAALEAGCSFVDFTPSLGARVLALVELALRRQLPLAGRDGKTGETLVRSSLAPMFVARALRVRTWAGHNLLGGGDGESLSDPDRAASKISSKGRCLPEILGYEIDAPVRIEYAGDMGPWKTAWDYVLFEGFLGTRMRMQFVWEGCDAALAAPLILDLARLTARAWEAGCSGELVPLAFFFKDPVGTSEHRLERQFAILWEWMRSLGGPVSPEASAAAELRGPSDP